MSSLSCGIVGLPNVGKSTLFNALTGSVVAASNYPFCTIDPNVGVVNVPDGRLPVLAKLFKSQRIVPAITKFVDIAGLVAGASKGEGLGNQFLATIRETDAIVQVVRGFDSADVVHVAGKVDPIQDIEVINLELLLSDLQMCEQSLSRLEKLARGKKELLLGVDTMKALLAHLNANRPVRAFPFTPEQRESVRSYPFLTGKQVLYVVNVSEQDLPSMENGYVERVRQYAAKEGSRIVPICAKLEEEIAGIESPQERQELLEGMGLAESGLDRLIRASFEMLGLITFLTAGEMEARAWTIPKGATAAEAAGKIHTDIQKGFIRAEVVSFDDLVACGGRVAAKEAGKVRYEGREYVVQDGDVILFMHN